MNNDRRHAFRIRVLYAETDKMGVAYHARYFEWFERARTELLRQAGCPYTEWEERGYRLPVIECQARFMAPVRYDDALIILPTVTDLRPASITIAYEVFKEGNEIPVASGYTKHALVGENGKIRRFPPDIWEKLEV